MNIFLSLIHITNDMIISYIVTTISTVTQYTVQSSLVPISTAFSPLSIPVLSVPVSVPISVCLSRCCAL